jgi:signal transduction histidine kinase
MSLRATLLAAFAYVLVVVIVMLEVPLVLNVDRRVDAEIKAESSGQALLIATSASDRLDGVGAMQQLVDRSARALGGRVMVVGDTGRVIADSAGTGLRGTSYRDRPEVAQALSGETSQGTRHSSSLGEDLLYTAGPVLKRGQPIGAVRVTQSVDAVNSEVRDDALALVAVGVGALILGLGVAWLLARFLSSPLASLAGTARRVAGGDLEARAPARGSREAREVAEAFNDMTARLQSVLAAQRDFVANASHQLRTPLTGLRLRIEAARDRSAQPEVARDMEAAEHEVERLAGLLDSLLTLAAEGQRTVPGRPVRLAEAARAAAERWQGETSDRGQRIALSGEGDPAVLASADDVQIALDNLIENAAKYSPRGGDIELEWGIAPHTDGGPDGRHGYLAVGDAGPGLSPGERERVLGRFYRGEAGATTPGTGLGLAIVDVLTRRWGGSVELRNRPGGGLRAEVRLPLAEALDGRAEALPDPEEGFDDSLPGRR